MIPNNYLIIATHFHDTIQKWIAHLNDYSFETLTKIPQEGVWSVGQVYVHIIGDTTYYIDQLKVASKDRENRNKHLHTEARLILDNNSFPDRRLENPNNHHMPQPKSKEVLLQGLLSLQNEVIVIAAQTDLLLAAGKSEHPAFGFFTALEWLQWATAHMRHHFHQKERIDTMLKNKH